MVLLLVLQYSVSGAAAAVIQNTVAAPCIKILAFLIIFLHLFWI